MLTKRIILDVELPRYRVHVGRQGEHDVTSVQIDCTEYIMRYGEGTPSLVCKNPNESTTYSVPLIREGAVVTWVVGVESTATSGRGQAVLLWYPNNGGEAKTADIEFCVEVSAVHNNAVSVIAMIEDLKEQIKQIQEDGIDNEAIERLISEYLAEHPIEGVTADAVKLMLADYVKTGDLNAAIANYVNAHKDELKGEKGDTGETGPKGDTGERGEAGQKGDKGDKGDPFTYSDFTPEQLEALKGPKGDPGEGGSADKEQLQTLIDASLIPVNAGLSELQNDMYDEGETTEEVAPIAINPNQYLAWGVSGSTASVGMEITQRVSSYAYHGLRAINVSSGDTVVITNRIRFGVVFRGWFIVDDENKIVSMRDAITSGNEIVTDTVLIPDGASKILINTFDTDYLSVTKITHKMRGKRLKVNPEVFNEVKHDVNRLMSSLQPTGMCWDWWIRAIASDVYGNIYIGYVDEDGYIGVLKRGTDGHIEYARLGKSYNNDDHNGAAVTVLTDGKILITSAHGHSNDNKVMVYRSKESYSISDGFDDFGFELTYPEYSYLATYSQTFEYNGMLYSFMRVLASHSSGTTYGWACLKSSDNGENWTFNTCISFPDPYVLFVPVKGTPSKVRFIAANNPTSGNADYRGGFIDFVNDTVTDLNGSTIGYIRPINGTMNPSTSANKSSMTYICDGTKDYNLARLLDCAVTCESDTVILLARSNTETTDWEYIINRNGVETVIGNSGLPFGGAESASGGHTYISGAVFVDADTVCYSTCVGASEEGEHEVHIVSNDSDKVVKHSGRLLIRPIYKDGIVALQSGIYGGFNTFWNWNLSPVFIDV